MQELGLRKGPWIEEEDEKLAAAVSVLGERRWDSLAKASGLRRSGKSCRLRWLNYLRPNLKHGDISPDEERIIVELHEKWGNKWSRIARGLPGRTDNEIKNYWRCYSKKKAQVVQKECFSSTTNAFHNNNSLTPECRNSSPCSIRGERVCCKYDSLGQAAESSNALEVFSLTNSPYEARLTEWMLNWPPDDTSKVETKDEVWNLYHPKLISDECNDSPWEFSLWDGQ